MLNTWWLLILLPLAVFSGWLAARHSQKSANKNHFGVKKLPLAYFRGLNFLLNEQSDNAIDAFQSAIGEQSQSVEVQLALGNLFRRRGEIEKATLLHEDLIAKTKDDPALYALALYELAQDYQKAGLFDRAENLYLELTDSDYQKHAAATHLLQIYEQEKDWKQAVLVIDKFVDQPSKKQSQNKSHYLCELAELSITEGRFTDALEFIKQAIEVDTENVRAMIQSGRIEAALGHHKPALDIYKQVVEKNSLYIREVIDHIANAYRALNDQKGLNAYLGEVIEQHKSAKAMLLLTENLLKSTGPAKAEDKLAHWLRRNPSISGLRKLIDIKLLASEVEDADRRDLQLLSALLDNVLESQPAYQCRQCGYSSRNFYWHCPSCRSWNSITAQRQVLGQQIMHDSI